MESELRALVALLEDAWNRADSEAFAAVFAEDADFIHILGGHYVGRKAVEAGHRTIFDTIYKGSRNSWKVEKIRQLGPDVAVVFTVSELTFNQGGARVSMSARPTMTAAKREGKWQVQAFQNTLISEANPEVQKRLTAEHPYQGSAKASRD